MKNMMTAVQDTWDGEEAVILENNRLRVVVLPDPGAKLVSVYQKEQKFELAAQPTRKKGILDRKCPSFAEYDPSGMDDAFPNINPEDIKVGNTIRNYPDHGEIWSSPFSYKIFPEKVQFLYRSSLFEYIYQKEISLDEDSVIINYHIEKESGESLPCIWTFHGLLRYEENMEIFYDDFAQKFMNVFENNILGNVGTKYTVKDSRYDFGHVPAADTKSMVKYYVDGEMRSGFCGVRYPSQNIQASLTYDARILPYLGVWITAGGFLGDHNCALEPSNGYYDSISCAKENKKLYELEVGKPLDFSIRIKIEKMEKSKK
ncbi:MAG: hypothetical protein EOM40_04410 [Clostridia bacterium]|nr:hypothetical protein [Clostridia bacterium]NCC42033.1 hypothetical protein [Clostridia bacterium]